MRVCMGFGGGNGSLKSDRASGNFECKLLEVREARWLTFGHAGTCENNEIAVI